MKTNDLQYDSRSAFTLSLNHRDTFTGITDKDRSLTTRRFAELYSELVENDSSQEESMSALGKDSAPLDTFQFAGRAKEGLKTRQGHTELAVGLARLAGLTPS